MNLNKTKHEVKYMAKQGKFIDKFEKNSITAKFILKCFFKKCLILQLKYYL